MLAQHHLDYFKLGEIENEKFWRRLGGKPDFRNKSVLDFGCGHGSLAVDIALSGAKRVIGVDLEKEYIDFAKENLERNYPALKNKLEFHYLDILKQNTFFDFDYIVSKDTFEHTQNLDKVLEKMFDILSPTGKAMIGFGPLYNFYNGDHGRAEAILPWFHLIIPENILLKRINKKRVNKVSKIEELGLSKLSYKQYSQLFENSKFKKEYYKINLSDHPVSVVFNLLRRIKFFEEYCTYNIYCILGK